MSNKQKSAARPATSEVEILMQQPQDFTECAERLKALADPDRLRIVTCLLSGPRTVGDLASELNEEVVKISHHLSILRRTKILLAKKLGRFVQYSVNPEVLLNSSNQEREHGIDFGCCRLNLAHPAGGPVSHCE